MKITVFTIRNKATKEIIYAEGTPHDERYPEFKLDKKYFTEDEWKDLEDRGAWRCYTDYAQFDEEMRHLMNYEFELIEFNTDEVYEFVSETTLQRIK